LAAADPHARTRSAAGMGGGAVHPLRLEQMAYFDAGPFGLVDLAVELGIPAVSFWTSGAGALEGACLVGPAEASPLRRRLDETGVVACR